MDAARWLGMLRRSVIGSWILLVMLAVLSGCATLRGLAALRYVDFSLAGTSGATLAGVPVGSIRHFEELSLVEVARLGGALSRGQLPLEVELQVRAENPADNVTAQLVAMDWTLFLDDQATVSGALEQEYLLPPGEPTIVTVPVRVDLLEFFDDHLEGMVALALAASGTGDRQRIQLEATPSIQTPLGPMRYPRPVRIEYEIGS